MRKLFPVLAAAAIVLGLSQPAVARPVPFVGTLAVQIGSLDPIALSGSGIATVNEGSHLTSLQLPASPFATTGLVVPVTDPAAFPIAGVQATLHNGAGSFSGDGGLGFGGAMPVLGVAKVCLFTPCQESPPSNVSVPLSVIGAGGTVPVDALVDVTVRGAPWTTGTVTLASGTTAVGFVHGPASAASSTALASGVVGLVTPIYINTNVGASATIPALGLLTLHFVPEPGTLLLLGAGVIGLVACGRHFD